MRTIRSLGFALLFAGAVLATLGCPSEHTGKLVGWVTDEANTPLPFVEVAVAGNETSTDGSGLFVVESVRARKAVTVKFSLEGYADTSKSLVLNADSTNTLNVAMKELSKGKVLSDASTGGSVANDGNTLTLPAGAIDTEGTKAGAATVHVTSVDLTGETEADSLPGGLQAVSGNHTGVLDVQALANVVVNVNGATASLQAGAAATLRVRVVEGSSLHAGDSIGLWHFDVSAGAWAQYGAATVVESDGGLFAEGPIHQFGWWCCATVHTGLFTISGHVLDSAGQPVENALVVAHGIGYHGATWTTSGEDGAYFIRVLPNTRVRVDLVLPGAYYAADTIMLTSGDAGGTLEGQDLAPDFTSCVQGHVTEEDGTTPVEGTQVYSSAGGSAVTASDGSFCMLAPGSTDIAVYVLGRPPVFTTTPAAATCDAGNGADVTISVDYPQDGDRLGFVVNTLRTTEVPFAGKHTYLSSSALFYSGFKGDQFAPYDPDAPLDGYTVYTTEPTVTFDLGIYFGLLTQTLAFNLAFDLDFGINETFGLEEGEVSSITKIGALDAGSPATLTNGETTADLLRPLDYFYDFKGNGSLQDLGYAMLEPWMGGFYFQKGITSEGFNTGDTLTFTWPGGVDMGAFSAQGVVPGNLILTAPANVSAAFDADAVENGLSVEWDTEGQGSYVTLILESIVIDHFIGPVRVGAVVCKADDDGAYVIPPEALAQLPSLATTAGTQINYLFAKRHTVARADVPLARGNGSGYVVMVVDTNPVLLWSLDARVLKR